LFATRQQVDDIIKAAAHVRASLRRAVHADDPRERDGDDERGFDLPTVQGIVVFSTVAIIALNLIVDLLYAWIDPRIRLT